METIWIKNPLAIYTGSLADAEGGIVIKGNTIIELVGKHKEPTLPVDYSVDASPSCCDSWAYQCAPPLLSNPNTCLP